MAKKHLTAMAVFIALSACVAADRNTESEAKQSGVPFNLKIAHLGKDQQILTLARDVAEKILEEDPQLAAEKNYIFAKHIKKGSLHKVDWGNIS